MNDFKQPPADVHDGQSGGTAGTMNVARLSEPSAFEATAFGSESRATILTPPLMLRKVREDPPARRPTVGMMASAVFILIGMATMFSGAVLEGAGVLLVALGCSCIGLDPTKRR